MPGNNKPQACHINSKITLSCPKALDDCIPITINVLFTILNIREYLLIFVYWHRNNGRLCPHLQELTIILIDF